MGCSNGKLVVADDTIEHKVLDSRVPLTRAQVEDVQAFWDYVKRRFEETAVENLIRFFRLYPYFQVMFSDLGHLKDESDMRLSPAFEMHAMSIFHLFDDVIESLDGDYENITRKIEDVARIHARIEGFSSEFFQYMEEPFIDSLREKLWEQFSSAEEEAFRKLFKWVQQNMTMEVEAIQYRLIPGD